ncbi:MAG TPA: hypothetical protein EYO94_13155 [Acidobacteria bacterium]|nr:hypothetical protein [Acidobacteriota bacterium]HIM15055.1 hypothetical protein [Acidobacteriota bacterium]
MNTSRAKTKTVINRQEVLQAYRDTRERTGALFGIASQDAYYDRPAPLRHPVAFFTTVTFPHLRSMSQG